MKLKYILPITAAIAAIFTAAAQAADVTVSIDDVPVNFPDVQPIIVNERTYVPLRGVFENLGYTISWDDSVKTATLTFGDTEISANTSDLRITKDGYTRAIGGAVFPIIRDGRMLLPVRALSEASGCTVTWDADMHNVGIYTADTTPSDYSNPNGTGTKGEEDYIQKAYDLCDEVKHIAAKSNNEALLRFLGKGYENAKTLNISSAQNALIKKAADDIYALEPAGSTGKLQPFFKTYADTLCKFIIITESYENGEYTAEEAIAQIDLLKEEKDELAIKFSVALNDYFKENNVFYEGLYGEYVLDMMK